MRSQCLPCNRSLDLKPLATCPNAVHTLNYEKKKTLARDNARKRALTDRPKHREYMKHWARNKRAREPEKYRKLAHERWMKRYDALFLERFGITYQSVLDAQDGRCGICGTSDPGAYERFNADHDHETNKFRGLLCHRCNKALGQFKDKPEFLKKALVYLTASREKGAAYQ